jgi:antitoxin component YwqK of YwqJK toxin-antitoxin module
LDSQEGFMTRTKRKELSVKEISYQRTDKKGRISTTNLSYNELGFLLNSKNDKYERRSTYVNDSLEKSRFTQRKRKTTEFKLSFNEKGRVLVDERFKNGKLISKTENSYLNSHLVNAKLLHKGKPYEMKYHYNDQDKLTKTEFFKRGKLKESWVYECKPEGEIVASNKTEIISSKCEYREESLDGSYAVFTRTIRDGKAFLEKITFNKDSVQTKQEYFVKDSILTYRLSYTNNTSLTENFRKGKFISSRSTKRNDQGKTIEEIYTRKGKIKRSHIYEYDQKGNVTLHENYRKGKLTFLNIKTYHPSGESVVEEMSHRKDRKITSKRILKFNENGLIKSNDYFSKGKLISHREYSYVFKN